MGYSSYFAPIILDKWFVDIFKNNKITLSQKLWAQKRGFLSNKITFYGLTNENYVNYLPDFDYFWLHPIDGAYSHWIDDKLTIRYILQPFAAYLPGYYFHIYHGEILRLMDCPGGYGQTIQGIINLLREKRLLAAKFGSGTLGKGFYKLAYDSHNYFINNQLSTELELQELIGRWLKLIGEPYIITEFIQAHRDLRKIWDGSPNSLRIMVIRERDKLPEIVFCFIRFGVKNTGVIEDPYGVRCRVDLHTGSFSGGEIHTDFKMLESKFHPDSKVLVEGVVPHWNLVKEKILEISDTISQVKYLGYDVIITDDGFKIIEINSHQGLELIQYYQPLLIDGVSKDLFKKLLEDKKAGLF
jgi:hypothetical protein